MIKWRTDVEIAPIDCEFIAWSGGMIYIVHGKNSFGQWQTTESDFYCQESRTINGFTHWAEINEPEES